MEENIFPEFEEITETSNNSDGYYNNRLALSNTLLRLFDPDNNGDEFKVRKYLLGQDEKSFSKPLEIGKKIHNYLDKYIKDDLSKIKVVNFELPTGQSLAYLNQKIALLEKSESLDILNYYKDTIAIAIETFSEKAKSKKSGAFKEETEKFLSGITEKQSINKKEAIQILAAFYVDSSTNSIISLENSIEKIENVYYPWLKDENFLRTDEYEVCQSVLNDLSSSPAHSLIFDVIKNKNAKSEFVIETNISKDNHPFLNSWELYKDDFVLPAKCKIDVFLEEDSAIDIVDFKSTNNVNNLINLSLGSPNVNQLVFYAYLYYLKYKDSIKCPEDLQFRLHLVYLPQSFEKTDDIFCNTMTLYASLDDIGSYITKYLNINICILAEIIKSVKKNGDFKPSGRNFTYLMELYFDPKKENISKFKYLKEI